MGRKEHAYVVRFKSKDPAIEGKVVEIVYASKEASKAEEDFKFLAAQGYDVEIAQQVTVTTESVIFHSGHKIGDSDG